MGLISFIKNAGASLFGGSEAKAAPAEELKKELEKHGLDSSDIKIEVDGDKVKVSGAAKTQEEAEKIAIALGNTKGVGTVQNDIKPAAAAVESRFYTVVAGDTLWAIAEREYGKGHGDKFNVIFEANKPMLKNPDLIYPGQVLRVPALP
ncbi:LysM domain-containing protein [Roseiarcus fermentans]|uniref:LysM domain-containing protein n=1 Tax=Roseiarcus fermentans TaxID=1473586 RepID=A0A366EJG0_9HYPH|nr:peptidoglycan-binding protein LysM [Roseiarcus fermentans]RBP02106.1 LysM domain-containing protein [Roseiarcus fermentans]